MNEKMYVALKVVEHPALIFEATEVAWPSADMKPGVTQEWPVRGGLTIAGTRRDVSLVGRVTKQPDGAFAIEVAAALRLTDFAIKPPTFMAVVRTGDDVNVQVRWVVRPSPIPLAVR